MQRSHAAGQGALLQCVGVRVGRSGPAVVVLRTHEYQCPPERTRGGGSVIPISFKVRVRTIIFGPFPGLQNPVIFQERAHNPSILTVLEGPESGHPEIVRARRVIASLQYSHAINVPSGHVVGTQNMTRCVTQRSHRALDQPPCPTMRLYVTPQCTKGHPVVSPNEIWCPSPAPARSLSFLHWSAELLFCGCSPSTPLDVSFAVGYRSWGVGIARSSLVQAAPSLCNRGSLAPFTCDAYQAFKTHKRHQHGPET